MVRALVSEGVDQKINECANFGLGKATRGVDRINALRFNRQFRDRLCDLPLILRVGV